MQPCDRVWRERGLRQAVLAGDERAWNALYDDAFPGLSAYVRWRCGGLRDVADEIVQETWLTAVRRLRSFDPEQGSFAAWLRGIAVNLLRNQFRRDRRRQQRRQALAPGEEAAPDASPEQFEQSERVARALAELPDHYEAVLRAKYLDGLRVAVIAAERGDSEKAVESLLTRARQAFRITYLKTE
jgi:RNA polymerase sigma-70 factor (ECF subfamily)